MKQEQISSNRKGVLSDGALSNMQDEIATRAVDAYEAIADVSAKKLAQANRKAVSLIRHYPLQAAAGALAIGFLAGVSLARRRS